MDYEVIDQLRAGEEVVVIGTEGNWYQINGKIPTVKQLSEEYAKVLSAKKKAYSEYREAKEEMKKYTTAKHNVDEFLRKSEQEEKEQKKRRVISR